MNGKDIGNWHMIFSYVTLLFVLFVKAIGVNVRQSLSDAKKSGIMVETQKLVNEWPLEVIKHQEKENRKVLLLII
jgi:hypothetical protein